MKKSTQNILLVLAVAALLSACAPRGSDSGVSDLSSRLSDGSTSSSKSVASCNQATSGELTAKLRAYSANGTVNMQYMIVRLSALPATFKSDASYITMWKWLSNTGGSTYLDSTPLSFKIMNPSTNTSVTDWKTTLRWSDVSASAAALGYSDAQSFFNAMKILVDLKDVNGEYDVLKVANYSQSTNKVLNEVDALMPLFYVNPADYAYEANGTNRSSALQALHPFKSYANQGYTTSQYVTMANNFCF